jgi:hypothetical protein
MVVERDMGTLAGEGEPDRASEPLPGTRHQHDLIAQGEIHDPPWPSTAPVRRACRPLASRRLA